jgi:hypothetical protein
VSTLETYSDDVRSVVDTLLTVLRDRIGPYLPRNAPTPPMTMDVFGGHAGIREVVHHPSSLRTKWWTAS